MIRNFDYCGRITIPKEMREKLGMVKNTSARIELVEDMIILTNDDKKATIFAKNDKKVKNHVEKKRA